MLILTRTPGESIRIGDDITVRIVEVNGNQVRLGIAAPRSVSVHREEIYNKIQEQVASGEPDTHPAASTKPTISRSAPGNTAAENTNRSPRIQLKRRFAGVGQPQSDAQNPSASASANASANDSTKEDSADQDSDNS